MPRQAGLVIGRLVLALALLVSSSVDAQADPAATDLTPGGLGTQPVDRTRLDVSRLPVEATAVTRAMYHRGWLVEAQLGALTYVGDARQVSSAGPRLAIALGYELTQWLLLLVQVEGSMHQTSNRPPPSHTAYQLVGSAVGARFSIPIDARFAVSAAALCGLVSSSGDVLRALDFKNAFKPGLSYGGELGFDYHLRARHHSLGLLAGVRHLPSLERDGLTLAAYGSAYLRYVF